MTATDLAFINGYTLCSLLRADPLTAEMPVVVITVDANLDDIIRARSSGADSVLVKPCRTDALLHAVAVGRGRSWTGQKSPQGTSARSTFTPNR
jgi:CheY-like chemotaxis protein